MRRRAFITGLGLTLAIAIGLPGVATAAAGKRLPITTGPAGAERYLSPIGPKIVGGKPVADWTYPFQAALLVQSFGTTDYERQFCGGSLVSPDAVLTSAHCVEFFGDEPGMIAISDLRVVVGRTALSSTQGQKRRVLSIDVHPRWNSATFSFDVAVIHLALPITGIRPVALIPPGTNALERPGLLATISGWGNLLAQPAGPGGGDSVFPDRLYDAKVPIVSRNACRTAYAAAGLVVDYAMLCAGRIDFDSCEGDSGGPLFFKAAGVPGYVQVGITSWGLGCGAAGFPGVYTRLSTPGVGNFVYARHRWRTCVT